MRLQKQAGFSLVELLVAMGFSLAVLASIYGFFRAQVKTTKGQESRMEAHEYAMMVLDSMVREIRNTGYSPSNGTPCAVPANTGGIVNAASNTLTLVYETAPAACDRVVTFTYNNAAAGDILRDGQALTQGNVAAFSFTYFPQQTGAAPAVPYCVAPNPPGCVGGLNLNNIQRIDVSITVRALSNDTNFGGQTTVTMTSSADLRNHGL